MGSFGTTIPASVKIRAGLRTEIRKEIVTKVIRALRNTINKTDSFLRQIVPQDTTQLISGALQILRSSLRDIDKRNQVFKIFYGYTSTYATDVNRYSTVGTNWTKAGSQGGFIQLGIEFIKVEFRIQLNNELKELIRFVSVT